MIQDFWMTIPPVFEQQNIVKYIDGEISKIDAQISKANRRIELLNELKQSVITEAVTGKIKVI
jgi:type I restriction enzyme S subunit